MAFLDWFYKTLKEEKIGDQDKLAAMDVKAAARNMVLKYRDNMPEMWSALAAEYKGNELIQKMVAKGLLAFRNKFKGVDSSGSLSNNQSGTCLDNWRLS